MSPDLIKYPDTVVYECPRCHSTVTVPAAGYIGVFCRCAMPAGFVDMQEKINSETSKAKTEHPEVVS